MAVQVEVPPLPTPANPQESPPDAIGAHRVAGWIRRSCCALLADLEIVESGSLDVLLYCGDDLAAFDDAPFGAIDRVVDR